MHKGIRFLGIGLGTMAAIGLWGGTLLAQDPVKVAPNNYKTALENETVRVCDVWAKAGDKIATHAHPDHLVYAKTAGKLRFTYPDGKTKEVEMKVGEATWIKAETHAVESVGPGEFKAVVFELRKPPIAGAAPAKMPETEDQAKLSPESTKVLVDNERVRLMEVRVKPGGKLAKHSHPGNVGYGLTDSKVKITTYPEGKTEERPVATGQVIWSGPVTHAVENVGTTDSHLLLLELK